MLCLHATSKRNKTYFYFIISMAPKIQDQVNNKIAICLPLLYNAYKWWLFRPLMTKLQYKIVLILIHCILSEYTLRLVSLLRVREELAGRKILFLSTVVFCIFSLWYCRDFSNVTRRAITFLFSMGSIFFFGSRWLLKSWSVTCFSAARRIPFV